MGDCDLSYPGGMVLRAYRKGDQVRVARSTAAETALIFDGWVLEPGYTPAADPRRHVEIGELGALPELSAASVAAVEDAAAVAPTGTWDFATAPTVGGAPVGATPPDASTAAKGIVELATSAEATTGADTVRAVTPAGLKAVADTKVALTGDQTIAGAKTYSTGVKVARLAVGNHILTDARQPAGINVVINGSTLPATPLTNKTGDLTAVTFLGGFTNEAGFGVTDPGFLFGANDYIITGTTAGDMAAVTNFWGRLSETHLRTPGASLTNMYGLTGQANIESEATGATITGWMAAVQANGPRNTPGASVANAAAIYATSPSAGTATNTYNIYAAGTAANYFGGKITANDGIQVNGGSGGFKVNSTTPNTMSAAAGVYAGVNGTDPGIELANGTANWRLDNSSGTLRFLRAGVSSDMELAAGGHLKTKGGVGFFNTAAITSKPSVTGSRGGNAALTSLLTALASYGLVTDSTTA